MVNFSEAPYLRTPSQLPPCPGPCTPHLRARAPARNRGVHFKLAYRYRARGGELASSALYDRVRVRIGNRARDCRCARRQGCRARPSAVTVFCSSSTRARANRYRACDSCVPLQAHSKPTGRNTTARLRARVKEPGGRSKWAPSALVDARACASRIIDAPVRDVRVRVKVPRVTIAPARTAPASWNLGAARMDHLRARQNRCADLARIWPGIRLANQLNSPRNQSLSSIGEKSSGHPPRVPARWLPDRRQPQAPPGPGPLDPSGRSRLSWRRHATDGARSTRAGY